MTEQASPVRARRMPPAPRARVMASAPNTTDPMSEAKAASSPASRPGPESAPRAQLPARVGPYRVHGQLGAGGVGVVYEAEDDNLGRRLAVKVLHDHSPASVARFRREARAMGQVNHPNVATIYDVGEADGRGYIAMELVCGQTLRQWLAAAPSWTEVMVILDQAGQGLMAAHAAGLVHRDFKPDNVLVGDDGRVRVVDFGLAKHHTELCDASGIFDRKALARELADGGITRTGSLMGTPAYMAPEHFRGRGDARSDQFGFCVVLYEALYGQLPFGGESAEELFDATSRGRLLPWPKHVEIPIGVRAVLRRGLSANPRHRYRSMQALLEALNEAIARGDSTPKRRYRTKGTRSWRWKIVGGATGLLLGLGSAAFSSDPSEPTQSAAPSHRTAAPQRTAAQAPGVGPQSPASDDAVQARATQPDVQTISSRRTERPAQS
ncbi:MAG: serine/threonine-protein kinase [Myxococcota bacterium]